jgi:anti-anti-sigma regulatory factor
MKKQRKTIILSNEFLNQINSRASIDAIIYRLKPNAHYSIDFKNIDFISRAAAHELIFLKTKVVNRGIDITYLNVPGSINEMIQKVEQSSKSDVKSNTFVKQIDLKGEEELHQYLLSID